MTDAQLFIITMTDKWNAVSYVAMGAATMGVTTTPWVNEAWRCTRASADATAKNLRRQYRTQFTVDVEEARR